MAIKVEAKAQKPLKKRASLNGRIIGMLIFFSILTVASFAFIQIRTVLFRMSQLNAGKAKFSMAILMESLTRTIETTPTVEKEVGALSKEVRSFGEKRIFDEIILLKPEGSVVAAYPPEAGEEQLSEEDRQVLEQIFNIDTLEKWFHSKIEAEKKWGVIATSIDLITYLPLIYEDKIRYVVKNRFSLRNISEAQKEILGPVAVSAGAILLFNILLGFLLSRSIVRPINVLNDATLKIAGGRLDLKVDIHTNDEIEELGDTFNHMTVELVKMKERAENANPLTKLPGNNVIREQIEDRIRQGKKFVVIHSDLDNFKAFNDKYGIGEGDKAIELTARLFKEAIEKKGDREDFVGHEGGDDFVVITTPDQADELAKYFIQRFDEEIVKLYTEEDRKKGYIEEKNRQGVLCKFPLMSISLAGVGNHIRNFKSYAEITNVIPDLKEKAKAQPGSVFLLDRRKDR